MNRPEITTSTTPITARTRPVLDIEDSPRRTGDNDRVRAAEHGADLGVVVQERHELLPGVAPQLPDRGVGLAPLLFELLKRRPRGLPGRGPVDRLEIGRDLPQYFFEAYRKVLRIRWMLCRRLDCRGDLGRWALLM